jgi:hypothetical protein
MRPPQRPVAPPRWPAGTPPPRQPQASQQKPWYAEPTVLGTIGVLIVVAILFIVLITQIMAVILTRRALNRALLARQHLLVRADLPVYAAVEHLFGLQAQAPHAAVLRAVDAARRVRPGGAEPLLAERRGAGHRDARHDPPARRAGLRADPPAAAADARPAAGRQPARHPSTVRAVAAAGADLLDAAPMTLKDLGAALGRRWPDHRARHPGRRPCPAREPLVQVPPRGLWGRSGPPAFTTAGPGSAPRAGHVGSGRASCCATSPRTGRPACATCSPGAG